MIAIRDIVARRRISRVRNDGIKRISVSMICPCASCGADDSRDAEHARGCPALPAVPDADVYRMQREVAAAWSANARKRGA